LAIDASSQALRGYVAAEAENTPQSEGDASHPMALTYFCGHGLFNHHSM
jgi:hypothetical protein